MGVSEVASAARHHGMSCLICTSSEIQKRLRKKSNRQRRPRLKQRERSRHTNKIGHTSKTNLLQLLMLVLVESGEPQELSIKSGEQMQPQLLQLLLDLELPQHLLLLVMNGVQQLTWLLQKNGEQQNLSPPNGVHKL